MNDVDENLISNVAEAPRLTAFRVNRSGPLRDAPGPITRSVFLITAVTVLGCGSSSTLEIRPRASLSDSTQLAGLRLEIGGRAIQAKDYAPDEAGLLEVKLHIPDSGRLRIMVRLEQHGRLAAEGIVGWVLADDHEWGLDIFRSLDNPLETCIGCAGSAAVPIAAWAANASGELLWFAWGGKPKGSDIVF